MRLFNQSFLFFIIICVKTSLVFSQEINIQGNSIDIPSGTVISDVAVGTDFGRYDFCMPAVKVQSFVIQNTGGAGLLLTGTPLVQISGSPDFFISAQPSGNIIPAGGSLSFEVTYLANTPFNQSAVITIPNNDADENPYTFMIEGDGNDDGIPDQSLQKVLASDGATDDVFGISVSVSGDYALVGANGNDDSGSASGAAYIYERSGTTWNQVAKLTASDAQAFDWFGGSVAISANCAVIGAYQEDAGGSNAGAVYLFEKPTSGWVDMTETAKFTASDAASGDNFGYDVDISGNHVIVGASFDDNGAGIGSGSAYIFERPASGWANMTETVKLVASDAAFFDFFGVSVGISGNYAVIGASQDDDGGPSSGSAYIFERIASVWTESAKLTAGDPDWTDQFGRSVAIKDNYVVVGSVFEDDGGTDAGAAYVFERSGATWSQVAKLTASDAAPSDHFGVSVAINNNFIVVGANRDDDFGNDSGAGYVFHKGAGWTDMTETSKLLATDADADDNDGFDVGMSKDFIILGTYWNDDLGSNSGSASIYCREQEINVEGADSLISDGDLTPATIDLTDFGGLTTCTTKEHKFLIENTGFLDLALTGTPHVTITGADASQFSVSLQPPNAIIPTCRVNADSFKVTYTPSVIGTHSATVNILNDDSDEPLYAFDIQGMAIECILPVELVDLYTESEKGKGIWIKWSTSSEIRNEGFFVEHSIDGIHFKSLGFVESSQNTGGANYRFLHTEAEPGVNYYRLRMKEEDGQDDYSRVVAGKWGNEKADKLLVWPNPSRGTINLKSQGELLSLTGDIILNIRDVLGKTVFQDLTSAALLSSGLIIKMPDSLAGGFYVLTVESGGFSHQIPLILKR